MSQCVGKKIDKTNKQNSIYFYKQMNNPKLFMDVVDGLFFQVVWQL